MACAECGSRFDSLVVTASDRRIVRSAQPAAGRPPARGAALPNGSPNTGDADLEVLLLAVV
jgi:hypothetical protein